METLARERFVDKCSVKNKRGERVTFKSRLSALVERHPTLAAIRDEPDVANFTHRGFSCSITRTSDSGHLVGKILLTHPQINLKVFDALFDSENPYREYFLNHGNCILLDTAHAKDVVPLRALQDLVAQEDFVPSCAVAPRKPSFWDTHPILARVLYGPKPEPKPEKKPTPQVSEGATYTSISQFIQVLKTNVDELIESVKEALAAESGRRQELDHLEAALRDI